jgi:hypothetical protein
MTEKFSEIRILDNFYQTSSFYPMPVVLVIDKLVMKQKWKDTLLKGKGFPAYQLILGFATTPGSSSANIPSLIRSRSPEAGQHLWKRFSMPAPVSTPI